MLALAVLPVWAAAEAVAPDTAVTNTDGQAVTSDIVVASDAMEPDFDTVLTTDAEAGLDQSPEMGGNLPIIPLLVAAASGLAVIALIAKASSVKNKK